MSLIGLLSAVAGNTVYQRQLAEIRQSQPAPPVTTRPGARPAYIAALWRELQAPILVLTPRPEDARRLHDQLLTFLGEEGQHRLVEAGRIGFASQIAGACFDHDAPVPQLILFADRGGGFFRRTAGGSHGNGPS